MQRSSPVGPFTDIFIQWSSYIGPFLGNFLFHITWELYGQNKIDYTVHSFNFHCPQPISVYMKETVVAGGIASIHALSTKKMAAQAYLPSFSRDIVFVLY